MEYQRFVSYIYRYYGRQKGENCGFVKVEKRKNIVRLLVHMHLPEKTDETYQIFGFVREEGVLYGYLIGTGKIRYGTVDARIQREQDRLAMEQEGEETIHFGQLSGIVIQSSNHEWYGTVWDEEELRIEQFREKKAATEERNNRIESSAHQTKEEEQESPEEIKIQEMPEQAMSVKEIRTQKMRDEIDWEKLYQCCPVIQPVMNDPETEYFRMEPKDLRYLPKQVWYLGRNSFLLHGYYNYRYLILGRKKSGITIGIPGLYSPMEAGVAAMFGFPCFQAAEHAANRPGTFGYWCSRIIDD